MKIDKLSEGQIVYDAHSHKLGNTTMRTMGVWRIRIVSIDLEKGLVMASWNGNSPQRFGLKSISKWREKEPILVKVGWADRLATRAELKAMKEAK